MPICPNCDDEYDYIGVHWSKKCGFPDLTRKQVEVCIGLLMGDGWITTTNGTNKHHRLQIASTSEMFLHHVAEILEPFTTGVKFYRSGEKVAEAASNAGMNANPEKTNDQYIVHSRAHPKFDEMRSWYNSGQKRFPEDTELTQTILRYWYAGDGLLGWSNGEWSDAEYGHVEFAAQNEMDRPEFLMGMFRDLGFDPIMDEHKLRLRCEDSKRLLEMMGDPVPGYEYKWSIDDIETYRSLKA